MKIDFDPVKSARNAEQRGLPFECVTDFDWDDAVFCEDIRYGYPEQRFIAAGYLSARLHILCFTPVVGGVRIISLRKANNREAKNYGKPLTADDR